MEMFAFEMKTVIKVFIFYFFINSYRLFWKVKLCLKIQIWKAVFSAVEYKNFQNNSSCLIENTSNLKTGIFLKQNFKKLFLSKVLQTSFYSKEEKIKQLSCRNAWFGNYFRKQFQKIIFESYFLMFCKTKVCLRI